MPRVPFNPIRNVKLPSFREFNEELLGTDLYETGFDGQWAANDDYQLVSGLANLKQAILHRLITNPGELFAHPDYGAGLEEYISAPINRDTKNEIVRRIHDQLRKEPRIAKIVYIKVNTGDSETQIGTLKIDIGLVPITTNSEQNFHFVITERDWLMFNNRSNAIYYVDLEKERELEARRSAL